MLRDEVSGKIYYNVSNANVEGTPYLHDDWRPSFITYAGGLQVKNVMLKFDLYNHLPLFLRNDSVFQFVNEVIGFIIYNPEGDSSIFRKGFPKLDNITPDTYLQVLTDGPVKLLKYTVKTRSERKEFNSAVAITEFSKPLGAFYTFSGSNLKRLKKGEEGLKECIPSTHWQQVSKYIKEAGLNLKKEADLVKIFLFNDSL